MKRIFLVLSFFYLLNIDGQKLVKKAFVNDRTTSFQINSQYCYQVDLLTGKTNEVRVVANIEGEYSNDLLVSMVEEGTTVLIDAGFQPNFSNPNDKLSAHKVISIKLEIVLPEYMDVTLYGTTSNVRVEGKYKSLNVRLYDGKCILHKVGEMVEVSTQNGDILLHAAAGSVIGESQYGNVKMEEIPQGPNQYVLKTITGNINLRKTK